MRRPRGSHVGDETSVLEVWNVKCPLDVEAAGCRSPIAQRRGWGWKDNFWEFSQGTSAPQACSNSSSLSVFTFWTLTEDLTLTRDDPSLEVDLSLAKFGAVRRVVNLQSNSRGRCETEMLQKPSKVLIYNGWITAFSLLKELRKGLYHILACDLKKICNILFWNSTKFFLKCKEYD